jgi:hypothetical protein
MTPIVAVSPSARLQSPVGSKPLPQWYSSRSIVTLESIFVVAVSPGQLDTPPIVSKMGVPCTVS